MAVEYPIDFTTKEEMIQDRERLQWYEMCAFPLQKGTLQILWKEGYRSRELGALRTQGEFVLPTSRYLLM